MRNRLHDAAPPGQHDDAVGASRAVLPRRTLRILPRAALVGDLLVMILVGVAAAFLRTKVGWYPGGVNRNLAWLAGPIILLGWIVVIALLGGYRERLFGAGTEEYKILQTATLVAAGLTGVGCYLVKYDLSRGFFLLIFSLGAVALVAERAMLRRGLHRARRSGKWCKDVVVAGTPNHVDEIARVLSREAWLGYRVLGALVPPSHLDASPEETVRGTPILGTTDRAFDVLAEVGADVIFVAGGALDGAEQMRELVWELEAQDVQVVVAPNVTDVARERVKIRPVAGLPLVHIDPPRHVRASRRAKRTVDVTFAFLLLLGIAPFIVFIALSIKLSDRGPVLFRSVRIGRHGEQFACLKFRTMVVDAASRQAELQLAEGFANGMFKMKHDPRVTKPGRWLRRFSLDELPQLINVLKGDMSLVGPRPLLLDDVSEPDRFTRRRLHVRPGMTGLWQVSGRSDLSWTETIRLDLYYVDNWSMLQDISILAKTFGAVVGSRGAY